MEAGARDGAVGVEAAHHVAGGDELAKLHWGMVAGLVGGGWWPVVGGVGSYHG
ncbi:hypothetical protein GCM10022402_35770 [Salinactinospora qingdaonensis]|uniref:Uncharacterized protein n=1 Tax=Salinactinospora qingdaonensis TaxID=702744 RepID=A0ABP7G446_9ACTN